MHSVLVSLIMTYAMQEPLGPFPVGPVVQSYSATQITTRFLR